MFSISGFALMRAMGQQRGVTDTDALNRLSLIGGAVGLSPLGIVVGDSLIRRELDVEAPVTTSPAPTVDKAEVPALGGFTLEAAKDALTKLKFSNIKTAIDATSRVAKDTVIGQDPPPHQKVAITTTVTLTVSAGEQAQADKAVQEKTEVIAGKVSAISDEVVKAVPSVTPHVAAAVLAIKQAVDHVRKEAKDQPASSSTGSSSSGSSSSGSSTSGSSAGGSSGSSAGGSSGSSAGGSSTGA